MRTCIVALLVGATAVTVAAGLSYLQEYNFSVLIENNNVHMYLSSILHNVSKNMSIVLRYYNTESIKKAKPKLELIYLKKY